VFAVHRVSYHQTNYLKDLVTSLEVNDDLNYINGRKCIMFLT